MKLMPQRVKHRKVQRRVRVRYATKGNYVAFGEFGLQALENAWVSARQIEAGRVAANHFLAGAGRVYVRVFPHKPITGRPPETRMGKGKGEPEYWAAVVRPGTVLYEVAGVPEEVAKTALNRASHKISVRCKFLTRRIKL